MKDITVKCSEDIIAALRAIPEFVDKKWSVVDEDDLFSKSVSMKFPCAGVVYEGLRAGEDSQGGGRSSEITFAVYLLYQSGTIGNVDYKPRTLVMLDRIRAALLGRVSPSGHKWSFKFESPADDMHKALVYYQRWSAKVIL